MAEKPRGAPAAHARLAPAVLVTLGMLSTLGPLGTDAFLPALPAMERELRAAPGTIQLSLTAFTIGMAAGQLFAGPLSDGIGRRLPVRAGLAAMAVSSLVAASSPNAVVLIGCCAVMGVGASFAIVTSRAVVSDTVTGAELARGFALLGTLSSLGPIVGPIAGVAAMALWGWRGIFVGLSVLTAICLLAVVVVVPESLPRERRVARPLRSTHRSLARVLRSRAYARGACVIWFGFGGLFAYIAASSFLLQGVLGLDPLAYAVVFGINGAGLIAAGLVTARLSRRWSAPAVMALGLGVEGAGALTMVVVALTGALSPWLLLPALALIACSMGFLFGPAVAYGLRGLRDIAGSALGLLGAVQFLVAGIVAFLAAVSATVVTSFAITAATSVALAWLGWWWFRPRPGDTAATARPPARETSEPCATTHP